MTVQETLRQLAHDARRVAQSPGAFTNWRTVLADMARERFGKGPATLSFATRTGLRIDCPNQPGARVPIYEIFAEDCYHYESFLGPLLRRPIQVVDIGAHVGTFACRLAQLNPQASIRTYEPSPTTASFLRKNVEQNGLGDRIEVFEAALAATTGFADLDDNGGGSGLNGLVSAGHGSTATSTKVKTVAFDEAIADLGRPVDVVKMDCEGGEYDLVYGSSPSSWDSVQRVVLEYHTVPGESWEKLRAWFADRGLTVQAQEPITDTLGSAWLSRDPLSMPKR